MATINGTSGNDPLDGSDGSDTFLLQQGGDDNVRGLGGNDGFYFGAALTAADIVDGGAGSDSVVIQGNYASGLVLGDIRAVETLAFLSGADTRFGESGASRYSYTIATADSNLAAGATLSVIATTLLGNENLTFDGSAESDGNFRLYAGTGVDTLTGGAGNDGFFFGEDGNLDAQDRIDGGAGIDTVALRGTYVNIPFHPDRMLMFEDASLKNVEVLSLLSAHSNEFTGVVHAEGFRYDITMADGNVAAGARMDINGSRLGSDEDVSFNGSFETNGSFRILSGAANDFLIGSHGDDIIFGGLGADRMTGGAGNDVFLYHGVAESTAAAADTIVDFAAGDSIDLGTVDANALSPEADHFAFIGSAAFGGAAGQLRAAAVGGGNWLVEADVDGDGNADFRINVNLQPGLVLTSSNGIFVVAATPPPVAVTPVIAEVEINNGFASAQLIDRGLLAVAPNPDLYDQSLPSVTIRGAVSTPSDADYYKVDLLAGERLILDIDHVPVGTLDADVKVYGPDGSLIWENDDPDVGDPGSSDEGAYPGTDPHVTDSLLGFRAQASGSYTIVVGAFQATNPAETTHGSYDLQLSVGPPVSAAERIQEDVDALLSGEKWDSASLTYSFPNSAADYADYPANSEADTFQTLNINQQAVVRSNFANIAALTNLDFTELTANRGSAILRFAMTGDPDTDTAHAYLPSDSSFGGDAWFNKIDYTRPVLGNYAYLSFIHETGHALGLKHAHETPFAVEPDRDTLEYSVMTYRSFTGADLQGYRNETFGYPQSYMMYDIAALQKLYGADFGTNAGDTTYSWSPTTGQMSIDGIGQATPGANRVFLTIWDGGGNDTYDLSNYGNAVTIDLRPGEWTTTSQVQLANLGSGHIARGNVANSLLFEDDPRSLIENAVGGSAGDTLIANQAANHLTGNGGGDTFRWAAASDSAPGAGADTITDFQSGVDHIDLSLIDADTRSQADDSFHWIGSAAFSGAPGELRGEMIGGSLHIFADVNADAVPDFEIVLANQSTIAPADFIF